MVGGVCVGGGGGCCREAHVVDQMLLTTNEGAARFVKVCVRTICIPQVSVVTGVRVGG